MFVDVNTGRCILDDNHEINLRHIHETDFNHPLLNQPFTPRPDNIYQYSYEDIDSFLHSTIYIYSILLNVDKPESCQFIVKPSPNFQWNKPEGKLFFSINHLKPAQEAITFKQFEQLVSQLARNKVKRDLNIEIEFEFEFIENIITNSQFTIQDLPELVNGDLLFSSNQKLIDLLKKTNNYDRFELRYISPAIGLGVYSRTMIKNEEIICLYSGVKNKISMDSIKYLFYYYEDALNQGIDAVKHGNLGRFINHAASPNENTHHLLPPNNLGANIKSECICMNGIEFVLLSANREIQPGEQLLVNYGDNYFKHYNEFQFNAKGKIVGDKKLIRKSNRKKTDEIRILAHQGVKSAQQYLLRKALTHSIAASALIFILIKTIS